MAASPGVAHRRMTEEEYLALPQTKPWLEYVNGEVIAKCMGDIESFDLGAAVFVALDEYRRIHGGRVGFEGRVRYPQVGPNDYRLADVSYYLPGVPRRVPGTKLMTPPTLAVEVRSPDETLASQQRKCQYYRRNGVEVCWLIDPVGRRVYVYEGGVDGEALPADGVLTSTHLPGFSLPLEELFAALDDE